MVDSRENESGNLRSDVPGVRVHVFGRTDVGMVRDHNEDNFLIADLSTRNRSIQPSVQQHQIGELGSVFAVCDGMGGAAAGEVASQIAVDAIYEILQEAMPPENEEELARRLDTAVCEAGRRIYAESKANSARRGMGTTATVAVLIGERLLFGQVGDSRAHIVRNGALVQTTKDQSLVQQLIDANQLTIEEAKNFDRSNIILQALGTSEEVHVDVTSVLLRKGDILVICSDGLSGMVEPEDIRDVVLAIENPIEACQKLTQMACDNGGDDNVTVIVAKFDGELLAAPKMDDVVEYAKYTLTSREDDTSPTTSIRSISASSVIPGTVGGLQEGSHSASKRVPMVLLLMALAIIGLLIGFSLREEDGLPVSEEANIIPPVAVTPVVSTDESLDASSSDDVIGDAVENNISPPLADNTGPVADKVRDNIAPPKHNGGAKVVEVNGSEMESDVIDTDSVVHARNIDTATDSSTVIRSGEVDSASTQEGVSGDAHAAGKWTRTKSERKRVSAEEYVSSDDEEGNEAPIIEENPY